MSEIHAGSLGRRLKVLRGERGWSQERLAEELRARGFQMHQMTVSKIETGRRPVTVSEVFELAAVYRIDPMVLWHLPVTAEHHPSLSDMRAACEDVVKAEETLQAASRRLALLLLKRDQLALSLSRGGAS